jgi:hypothetical protein
LAIPNKVGQSVVVPLLSPITDPPFINFTSTSLILIPKKFEELCLLIATSIPLMVEPTGILKP